MKNKALSISEGPFFGPELKVLLSCVRPDPDQATMEQLREILQKDIDWDFVVATSDQHRVLPHLFLGLAHSMENLVPGEVMGYLRMRYHTNTIRNKVVSQELLAVLKLLKKSSIQAIPFKGPTQALAIYKNLSLRQFNDLDLLVHEADYQRARNVLLQAGYKQVSDWKYESSFRKDDGAVDIDLHKEFDNYGIYSSINFKFLWERLNDAEFKDEKLFTFSPEETLIILCVNYVKDWTLNKNKLSQLCDLANLIQDNADINWPATIKRAKEIGVQRVVFLGLSLANQVLGAPFPKEVAQKIKGNTQMRVLVSQARGSLYRLLSGESRFLEREAGPVELKLRHLRLKDKVQHRIPMYRQLLSYYILHSPDVIQKKMEPSDLPLPKSLYFVYYLCTLLNYCRRPFARCER